MADAVNGWSLPEELNHLPVTVDATEVADVVCRLELLRNALAACDYITMAAQARAIKESAIRIEAVNLVTTCRHLELDAAHQVTKNLERLVGEMETEVRALESAVPKIVVLTNAAGCVSQPG